MTIATRNGKLIIKNGKLAENCTCCGWYCYPTCGCSDQTPTEISATLSFVLDETAYGQNATSPFGGGQNFHCAKYNASSFSDVNKTVVLQYLSTSGGSCFYETPIISGEFSSQPGAFVPVGFVYMSAFIQCGASGTSFTITALYYSTRPFRGLNAVYSTFYAIKAPCEPEAYEPFILDFGINAAMINTPDLRSDPIKVFSPPCPNRTPIATPPANSDSTCSAFGSFQYELVQWTPVSQSFNPFTTVITPKTVGTLTVTV